MRHAVIDVGSNTIRLVVYEIKNGKYEIIMNDRDFSSIISYIENGTLSDTGVLKIKNVLARMKQLCDNILCDDIHCFATASFRNMNNSTELLGDIKNDIGLDIKVLSGNDEAYYDFLGLMSVVDAQSGIGFDLGGGSCQIFTFENNKLALSQSFPIGCLKMYDKFVSGELPTAEEAENISAYVLECLKNVPTFKRSVHNTVYAMGGTARAAAKLSMMSDNIDDKLNGYRFKSTRIDELCNTVVNAINEHNEKDISRMLSKRINTVVPGMIVIKTICEYIGAEYIETVVAGVREGYLHGCLLTNNAK